MRRLSVAPTPAKITRIMTDDALQIPGAIAVLTPEDLLPHVNAVRPGEPG